MACDVVVADTKDPFLVICVRTQEHVCVVVIVRGTGRTIASDVVGQLSNVSFEVFALDLVTVQACYTTTRFCPPRYSQRYWYRFGSQHLHSILVNTKRSDLESHHLELIVLQSERHWWQIEVHHLSYLACTASSGNSFVAGSNNDVASIIM